MEQERVDNKGYYPLSESEEKQIKINKQFDAFNKAQQKTIERFLKLQKTFYDQCEDLPHLYPDDQPIGKLLELKLELNSIERSITKMGVSQETINSIKFGSYFPEK